MTLGEFLHRIWPRTTPQAVRTLQDVAPKELAVILTTDTGERIVGEVTDVSEWNEGILIHTKQVRS